MKILNYLLIALTIVMSLVFAQPSWADNDRAPLDKNPDYIEITESLKSLLSADKQSPQAKNNTSKETQKKIDELQFQKYTLETGINWGQCQNETGKTLAVYGPKPGYADDDDYLYDNAIYFLADGQITKKEWDCDGVFIPNDVTTTVTNSDGIKELSGPIAVKIADTTQLVAKTNPLSGAVEFNAPPAKVFKPGEANWFIPNVSQAVIDTRVANAPAVNIPEGSQLVARKNPARNSIESNVPAQTQQIESNVPAQTQQSEPLLPKEGYYQKS